MLRILQQFILTTLLAVFASQASAMFIQADWFDPTQSGVGTNRYAYSHNDPINRMDPGGNDSVWSNGDGTWSSSDGSTYDPNNPSNNSYDIGSDQYGYLVAPGYSPPELPGVNDVNVTNSGRATVVIVTDRGVTASNLAMNPGHASIVRSELERQVQSQQPESAAARAIFDVATTSSVGSAAKSTYILGGRAAYRASVRSLKLQIELMRGLGYTDKQIAIAAHRGRRSIGRAFKGLTPSAKRQEILERNISRYGDPLGPSIEFLRGRGKSWGEIIESATRTGGRDLGF